MPLLLVRHAHAGRRSTYKGDDRKRSLSKRGVAQAQALVPLLVSYRPQRILSSPYVRCFETVRPTAEALGLPVESIEELAEGNEEEAIRLLRRMAGEPAVLCTHGDVALAVLEALGGDGVAGAREAGGDRRVAGEAERLQKGDFWVIQSAGRDLAISAHLRPGEPRPEVEG